MNITDTALEVLKSRYLHDGETPEGMCMRVADFISNNEEQRQTFFDMMDTLRFLPNSPCLANAGRPLAQLFACFVLPIEDSIESIFEAVKQAALIHRTGGGTGFSFSKIRPEGALVSTSHGEASGPVSFLKVFAAATEAINAGGFRRGANMGILRVDHPDIYKFIRCKDESSAITNFNLSVGMTDEFMQEVLAGEAQANALFDEIAQAAWSTGEPGVVFLDTINKTSRHPEIIEATNPCFSGDTLVAVADGRNAVTIKQLAEDQVGFPVYSAHKHPKHKKFTKSPDVKHARAFWTGVRKVINVVLSDGSFIRCTPEHLLARPDGTYVEAAESCGLDLQKFFTFSKFSRHGKWRDRMINTHTNSFCRQTRLVWEYYNGTLPRSYVLHHIDGDKTNDNIDNIAAVSKEMHDKLHAADKCGDKNPVHKVDPDYLSWYSTISCMKNNAKRYGWTDDRLESELTKFRTLNPEPSHEALYINTADLSDPVFVVGIEDGGYEDVYDLTVEDNHNFYIITKTDDENFMNCSGVLVHNCAESPLLSYESCVLGSINLAKFVRHDGVDWSGLAETTENAVEFLNNCIDKNKYPLPDIERATKKYRKIGLGVMGWADMLILLGIPYGSHDSYELAEGVMGFINNHAKKASAGRNHCVTTVAPTGTLALLAGCSGGIEPNFSKSYVRRIEGREVVMNHPLASYPEFVTAHDIHWVCHVEMQAAFQKHVDLAISKTINMDHNATVQDVRDAYIMAWQKGCKGITIFRDGSRPDQVLEKLTCPECGEEYEKSGGCSMCLACGYSVCSV